MFDVAYRIFLHSKDVTYARLHDARKLPGNDPRYGFYASASPSRLNEQMDLITEQISAVLASADILSLISLIFDVHSGGESSHRLFEMYSQDDDRLCANCPIRHVSEWSFYKLLKKYEERKTDVVPELFNLIRKEPTLASITEVM